MSFLSMLSGAKWGTKSCKTILNIGLTLLGRAIFTTLNFICNLQVGPISQSVALH